MGVKHLGKLTFYYEVKSQNVKLRKWKTSALLEAKGWIQNKIQRTLHTILFTLQRVHNPGRRKVRKVKHHCTDFHFKQSRIRHVPDTNKDRESHGAGFNLLKLPPVSPQLPSTEPRKTGGWCCHLSTPSAISVNSMTNKCSNPRPAPALLAG